MEQLKQDAQQKLNRILEIQEQLGKFEALKKEFYQLKGELDFLIDYAEIKQFEIEEEKKIDQQLDDIWNELNQMNFDDDDFNVFEEPQTNNKKRG